MELLALLAVLVAGYAAAGLVYRRYLRRRLPDPPTPPDEADGSDRPPDAASDPREATSDDGVHCPACGAANEAEYARCYNCANPLPGG